MSLKTRVLAGAAALALVGGLAATADVDLWPSVFSSRPRASSASRRLKLQLAKLSQVRSSLGRALNLRASVRAGLVMLIDRMLGALGLMLVRLRSALSKSSIMLGFVLSILAVYLCYGHREEPADYAFLPSCRYRS